MNALRCTLLPRDQSFRLAIGGSQGFAESQDGGGLFTPDCRNPKEAGTDDITPRRTLRHFHTCTGGILMERPWMKFHTRDWLDNKELRRCSPTARAVLTDLMCLAHEGVPYGNLSDKVGPLSIEFMASRCFVPRRVFNKALIELVDNSRIGRSDTNNLFIPRMVEDEALRVRRAEGGKASIGHPNTHPPKKNEGYPCLETHSRARMRADSGSGSSGGKVVETTTPEVSTADSRGIWSDEECSAWLSALAWNPKKITDEMVEKVIELDPALLPATEEDAKTLAGVHCRMFQFELFWQDYWRKVSKKDARHTWFVATDNSDRIVDIQRAQVAQTPEMLARPVEKRPHASTWLNQERWKDEVVPVDDDVEERALWAN